MFMRFFFFLIFTLFILVDVVSHASILLFFRRNRYECQIDIIIEIRAQPAAVAAIAAGAIWLDNLLLNNSTVALVLDVN